MAAGLLLLVLAAFGLVCIALLIALVVWLVGRTRTPAATDAGERPVDVPPV